MLRGSSLSGPAVMSTEGQRFHHVVGNNQMAVEAAGQEAERRGYAVELEANQQLEGAAEEVGIRLSGWLRSHPAGTQPKCLVSGGEPVVRLVDAEQRGRGGRNQQLVLAALVDQLTGNQRLENALLLSAGTDGEDGPTDAAGAWIDQQLLETVLQQDLDVKDFLARNDAYTFFDGQGRLLRTGPTHTNVCDLRIVLSGESGQASQVSPTTSG
jgi:hydroxypyruvate reductase